MPLGAFLSAVLSSSMVVSGDGGPLPRDLSTFWIGFREAGTTALRARAVAQTLRPSTMSSSLSRCD